ncbi:voltage-gated potassium channel [Rhizobium subbaraonis]|uniref:Voltage-gated potassium channel n=2 Tax=Rhizobium subbaraonis TaxID=908946 RepID=A0A285UQY5_9HYPH|nr:voltage-gated potassium channel [Rhizobium subbaraonis]
MQALRRHLRGLYFGSDPRALAFQLAMMVIDLAIIVFFIAGPYLRAGNAYLLVDYVVAAIITLETVARMLVAPNLRYWLARPMTWIDLVILATLLFPNQLANFAFLRALRIWSISQSRLFSLLLRRQGLSDYEDTIQACVNFLVFLFLVTGFVYSTFFYGENVSGFVDALYFTVATVTTTGFGDITLPGTLGKLTSIVTMIIGISLFVRLAQTIVKPHKVPFPCPQCGLKRHDADAVHCKACGHVLNIPDEGT